MWPTFRSPAAASAAACASRSTRRSAPRLLPLHALPAAHRHGLVGAGADRPGSLTVTQGEELIRTYQPPTGFAKLFCGTCGSALWSRSRDDAEIMSVRLGVFDDDPASGRWRQFVAYAAPWEAIPDDGLPRYAERPPPA